MSVEDSNSSVAPEPQEDIFAEFLDDYFAESDAHMTNARRHLLALESYVDSDAVELGLVEELLRSFHTIKGLSGMVGIREAEALAHEMESYLRALRSEKTRLSSEGMDALMAATQMLQQAIAARKEQTPPPNIDTIVARIQAILPEGDVEQKSKGAEDLLRRGDGETTGDPDGESPSPSWTPSPLDQRSRSPEVPPAQKVPPSPRQEVGERSRTAVTPSPPNIVFNNAELEKLLAAKGKGNALWHFQFTPNAELAELGINVNTIRAQLQELGEIIHASPRMLSAGSIVFDFILTRPGGETATDFDPRAKEIISASRLSYSPFNPREEGTGELGDQETRRPPDQGTREPGDQGGRGDQETTGPGDSQSPSLPVTPSPRSVSEAEPRLPVTPSPRSVSEAEPRLPVTPPERQPKGPRHPVTPSPPPSLSPPEAPRDSLSVMPANVVRVDLARLDELMQTLGELVISRARLEDRLKQLQVSVSEKDLRPLKETNLQMERQLRELRAGMLRVRLVPIGDIFTRIQFAIKDLARSSGKKVKVELVGQDTEIDKFVVERLMDPLLHLVRNAVSHGLETPSLREAKGKPREGKVVLRAATVGEMAVVEVEDDGKGVDAAEIIAKGEEMGIFSPEAVAGTPNQFDRSRVGTLLLDILCTSGFSTRTEADLTSGRGVGLAVVRRCVQDLGGSMSLDSQVGVKTKFKIQLPLTLAIADALLATAGGQTFAVPLSAVQEIIEVRPQDVTIIPKLSSYHRGGEGRPPNYKPRKGLKPNYELLGGLKPYDKPGEIIYHRGTILPLLRLGIFFNLPASTSASSHAFIVGFGDETNRLGIVVDRVIGQREIVVRPLTDELVNVPGISGATDLGDGRVVLILDAAELISWRSNVL